MAFAQLTSKNLHGSDADKVSICNGGRCILRKQVRESAPFKGVSNVLLYADVDEGMIGLKPVTSKSSQSWSVDPTGTVKVKHLIEKFFPKYKEELLKTHEFPCHWDQDNFMLIVDISEVTCEE